MHGTTSCITGNVNDHIPNQIIQQDLANDSVQINSTNILKRRGTVKNIADTKLILYHFLGYILMSKCHIMRCDSMEKLKNFILKLQCCFFYNVITNVKILVYLKLDKDY